MTTCLCQGLLAPVPQPSLMSPFWPAGLHNLPPPPATTGTGWVGGDTYPFGSSEMGEFTTSTEPISLWGQQPDDLACVLIKPGVSCLGGTNKNRILDFMPDVGHFLSPHSTSHKLLPHLRVAPISTV